MKWNNSIITGLNKEMKIKYFSSSRIWECPMLSMSAPFKNFTLVVQWGCLRFKEDVVDLLQTKPTDLCHILDRL